MSWIARRRRALHPTCAPIVGRQAAFSWLARRQPAVVLPLRAAHRPSLSA